MQWRLLSVILYMQRLLSCSDSTWRMLTQLTVYRSSLITMLKLLHATTKMIAVTSKVEGKRWGEREREREVKVITWWERQE